MKSNPKVSVVVITHRRVEILKRALRSVLAQTYSNIELIIVNDGSQDETEPYLEEFQRENPEVIVLHHESPRGACAARNTGIKAATGDFVAGLDDDDEFYPERVTTLVAAYEPKYAFVCAKNELITDGISKVHWKPRYITPHMLLWYNVVDNQVLAPRELFLEAGLFDEALSSSQDYDMWLRLLNTSSSDLVYCVQKPLQKIYVESSRGSVTKRDARRRRGAWLFYRKHSHRMSRIQKAAYLHRLGVVQGRPMLVKSLTLAAKIGKILSVIERGLKK